MVSFTITVGSTVNEAIKVDANKLLTVLLFVKRVGCKYRGFLPANCDIDHSRAFFLHFQTRNEHEFIS